MRMKQRILIFHDQSRNDDSLSLSLCVELASEDVRLGYCLVLGLIQRI